MKRSHPSVNTASSSSKQVCGGNEKPLIKQLTTDTEIAETLLAFLDCMICLDKPSASIYQCRNGHILCECCYIRLIAENRIQEKLTRCPLCRVVMPNNVAVRCLCAERVATLLPVECTYCSVPVIKAELEEHQTTLCPSRPTQCKYRRIGCIWSGPYAQLHEHEEHCEHSKYSLHQLLPEILEKQSDTRSSDLQLQIFLESLNHCRIYYEDLCTAHINNVNYINTIYYSTEKFRAFDLNWSIKFKFVRPEYTSDNNAGAGGYQLGLISVPGRSIKMKFLLIQNAKTGLYLPFHIHEHEFSLDHLESDFKTIPLANSTETYRILTKSKIHFRFIMMVMP